MSVPERQLGELGPYVLLEQIAVGGMAEIYMAKTRGVAGFEKLLCLKVIHPNYADDEHFIEMLIDEAKIAVGLNHVNIVQIFDLGRDGRTYYIAMELIEGADLFRIMRRLSEKDVDVPVDVAAYIAQEICTGLDYAHRKRDEQGRPQGIIHRDISPQNILISYSGEVKIVDFGIAKAASRSRKTQAGVIKGKYYYMSPEQAWGDPVDQRTDIFSAGIILYEVLTGQMLYLEEDMHRLLDMVRKADIPRPSTRRAEIPPQLETIVMKALAKRPADRWQTAHEFQAALTNFLFSHAPAFTPSRVARLLETALADDPAASRSRLRPPTRQVPVDHLMSRFDFRPQTEHSVIFRLTDLGHTDEAGSAGVGLAPEVDETVDEQDRGERTVISGPPVMLDMDTDQGRGEVSHQQGRPADEAPAFREALPVQQYREAEPLVRQQWEEEGPTLINQSSARSPDGSLEGARPRRKSRSIPVEIVVPRVMAMDQRPREAAIQLTPTPEVDFQEPTRTDGPGPAARLAAPRPTEPAEAARPAARPPPIPPLPPPPPTPAKLPRVPPTPPTGPFPLVARPALDWPPVNPASAPPLADLVRPQAPSPPPAGWPPQPPPQAAGWPPQPPPQAAGWPPQPVPPQPAGRSPQPVPLQPAGWSPQPVPPQPAGWSPQPVPPQPAGWPPLPAAAPLPVTGPAAGSWPGLPPAANLDAFGAAASDVLLEEAQAAARRRRRWQRGAVIAGSLAVLLGGAAAVVLFLIPAEEGGKINVISVPEGASVIVDGQRLPQVAPVVVAVSDLARPHSVEVQLRNFRPYQRTVTFAEGETSLQVLAVLTPIFGRLEVRSTPPEADVYVDNTHRGRTPLVVDSLTPTGEVTVELRRRGYKPVTQILRWEGRTFLVWEPTLTRSQP